MKSAETRMRTGSLHGPFSESGFERYPGRVLQCPRGYRKSRDMSYDVTKHRKKAHSSTPGPGRRRCVKGPNSAKDKRYNNNGDSASCSFKHNRSYSSHSSRSSHSKRIYKKSSKNTNQAPFPSRPSH